GVAALEALPPEAWERTAAPRGGVTITSLADARALLAWILASAGAHREAMHLLGLTLDAADAALDTLGYHARLTVHQVACVLGRPDLSQRAHERLREDLRSLEDARVLGGTLQSFLGRDALRYHADNAAYLEEIAGATERAWARAHGANLAHPFPLRALRYQMDFIGGAWDVAQESASVTRQWGAGRGAGGEITLARIARLQGRPDDGWLHVRQWLPGGAETEPGTLSYLASLWLLHLGGWLMLDAGDLDGARRWIEASDRWLAWGEAVQGQPEGQDLWAQYYRQAGDMERAYAHAERARSHATEPRQPLALLAAHRLLGELSAEMTDHREAEEHLRAALALADACAAPYERALTLLAIAALHAARGTIEEARGPLDASRATFARLGAQPALARADALIARLDATAHRPPAYPAGLSAREVEVLRLLAVGRTNGEIADILFLSTNTVRVHVRNIMTKTETQNRTAAAAFARAHDLG
ncbi:MAG: helix-turn-helix transcriptional regulator, partial [Chloroflexota bacterium]|nr:helix-turn-helix transcriptional regulator [Chloroflexota bacterium]